MGKKEKWSKRISKVFENFTDEEVLQITHDVVFEYIKLIDAEKQKLADNQAKFAELEAKLNALK